MRNLPRGYTEREAKRIKTPWHSVSYSALLRGCIFFTVCLTVAFPVFAQSAAEIDELLSTEAVTYEEAAWFVLRVAEIPGVDSPAGAFGYAADRKWLPAKAVPGGRARLDGVSLLVMRSFGFKGGLFFTLTKSSRYAYRELLQMGVIRGRVDPEMGVSGETLLFIAGNVLSRGREDD